MILGNRYEIIKKIGAGGMSIVYKARCQKLNRYVAVKVLRDEFNDDDTFVTKFRVEAQAAASLSHPNIINVFDVGSEGNTHYIVMEYIEGPTLKQYIREKNGLDEKETVTIALQIASALQTAHTNKIVHRDIKPQNIILSRNGDIKVTDFGIARATTSSTITLSANAIGSVHYFSPEQARGGFVDEKSDIYSLGVTMYEMVTNELPFQAESPVSVALQHLKEEFPHPSKVKEGVTEKIEAIILKATMKKTELRYQTAAEIIKDLRLVLNTSEGPTYYSTMELDEDCPTISLGEKQLDEIKKQSKEYDMDENTQPATKPSVDDLFAGMDQKDIENQETKSKDYLVVLGAVGTAIIIIAIMIFIGVKVLSGIGTTTQTTAPITLPKLVGMTKAEAETAVKDLGITLQFQEATSEEEVGTVTWVEEKTAYEKGDVITVKVSKGADAIILEDVTGENFIDARKTLTEQGFKVVLDSKYNDTVESSLVYEQNPASGAEMAKGDTVTIFVSLGKEVTKVTVPKLKGLTAEQAKLKIKEKGLQVGKVEPYYHNTVEEGLVISQSSIEGTEVPQGYVIDLAISQGKEPAPVEPDPTDTQEPPTGTDEQPNVPVDNGNGEETPTDNTKTDDKKDDEKDQQGNDNGETTTEAGVKEITIEATVLGDLASANVTLIQIDTKSPPEIIFNQKGVTKEQFPLKVKVKDRGEGKTTLRIVINGITRAEDDITF